MSLPKPQLRGLLQSAIKRNLAMTAGACTVTVSAYYVLVNQQRKQNYAAFYKDYDADAEFQRMRKLGLFQSCSTED